VEVQTSVFQMIILVLFIHYLMDNFSENFNLSISKFERVVFELLNLRTIDIVGP